MYGGQSEIKWFGNMVEWNEEWWDSDILVR